MKNINITVENKRAAVVGSPTIICGNSDYTVTFAFDNEWSLTGPKTARFVYVKRGEVMHEDVLFDGNTVAVPVLSDVTFVNVGVFAGDLSTTTPAKVNCHPSILCGSGSVQAPTPDVYSQIMALFESMAEKGAFGATEEQMQLVEQNRLDIAALADGTKKAGDANKLGGHPADYFFPKTGGDINGNIAQIKTGESDYTTRRIQNPARAVYERVAPNGQYCIFDETNKKYIIESGASGNHVFYGTAQGNLPLTGGTVDGHLFVASLEAVDRMIYLQNSMRSVFQKMHSNGLYQLYDKTNNKAIIESTLDGTSTFNGTASGNLPLTGGYASGAIGVERTDNAEATVKARNSLGIIDLLVSSSGRRGLYDRTKGEWLCDVTADGTATFHGTASGNLPLSGGEIASASQDPLAIKCKQSAYGAYAKYLNADGMLGYLGFNSAGKPIVMPNSWGNSKELHHDGNSAKVHVGTSAPNDTSAVWFDTSEV